MEDKNNFLQALMHMMKGNLGAGILGMPTSFAHSGLVSATIGLPILCLICGYSVHLLLEAAAHIGTKRLESNLDYAMLGEYSFMSGPDLAQRWSKKIANIIDGILLTTQLMVCCVYVVFVVDNMESVLSTYKIQVSKILIFTGAFPIFLGVSLVRTLNRLALASIGSNGLQAMGLSIIFTHIIRELKDVQLNERDLFMAPKETLLGFGSAMFAFEGISLVLPIFSRIKDKNQMTRCFGVVDVAFLGVLILYYSVGCLGYLRYGRDVKDSITLNLPAEPLYDVVRIMFTASIALTYPLQLYVPTEIVSKWLHKRIHPKMRGRDDHEKNMGPTKGVAVGLYDELGIAMDSSVTPISHWHEYLTRVALVIMTFVVAFTVPHLNLLMDLIGSMSGAFLSLTLPAVIHLSAFWNESMGLNRLFMLTFDFGIIIFSLVAGTFGSVVSLMAIIRTFQA